MNPTSGTRPETNAPAKFYVVTRSDLRAGQQAAQMLHAAIDFSQAWPEITKEWHVNSNTVVLLNVPSERDLLSLKAKADELSARYIAFTEEDLGNSLTAIAFEPGSASSILLTRNLPLALRDQVSTKRADSSAAERGLLTASVTGSIPVRRSLLQKLKEVYRVLFH